MATGTTVKLPWVRNASFGLQVWQEEGAHGQEFEPPPVRREVSQAQQAASSERAKQVVPALQSQHETFKSDSVYLVLAQPSAAVVHILTFTLFRVQDDVHFVCGCLSRMCFLQSVPGGQVLGERCLWEGVPGHGYSGQLTVCPEDHAEE